MMIGRPDMHIELCVRTVCELALHQEYCHQPQIVSVLWDGDQSNLLNNIVPVTSGYYTKACNETIDTPENIDVLPRRLHRNNPT